MTCQKNVKRKNIRRADDLNENFAGRAKICFCFSVKAVERQLIMPAGGKRRMSVWWRAKRNRPQGSFLRRFRLKQGA